MNFLLNLSLVLGHSVLFEQNESYPPEYCREFRNGGDSPAVPVGESTAQIIQAMTQYLPDLVKITNQQLSPTAQAQLAADQSVSPGYAQLQTDLYRKFGPELNRIGSDIAGQNMLAQSGNELRTLQGPGKDLISQSLALQKQIDPEYFQQRSLLNNSLNRLQDSIDLSGNLNGGARAEVERSLNRDNSARGLGVPSATSTVENAMKFGQAGEVRRLQQQQALAGAISVGSGFLPTAKTGIDPLQVGVGRSSSPNTGENKFTGNQMNSGANANQMSSQLLGATSSLQGQANDINSKRRDTLDRINETMSSLPSISD